MEGDITKVNIDLVEQVDQIENVISQLIMFSELLESGKDGSDLNLSAIGRCGLCLLLGGIVKTLEDVSHTIQRGK